MRRLRIRISQISLGYGILSIVVCALFAVILFGNRAAVVSLLASSASSLGDKPAVLFFSTNIENLTVGSTATIQVQVNTRVPVNAVGATIAFTPETLDIVGISKADSFLDLWTEETTIQERTGEIHFSGGTTRTGGHSGIATVLTLTVRAKKTGHVELSFKEADIFAHDGRGTALSRDVRGLSYDIAEPTRGTPETAPTPSAPVKPNPDLNGDSRITLADISILAVQLLASYNSRYDLNADGSVGLSDMSILFSRLRD